MACNDDTRGSQSEISIGGSPGDVFPIRLGGFNGSTGTGTIIATPNGPEAYCVGTPTLGGNGGAAGGAVYFDVTATQDISISSWYTNTSVTAGDPVSQTIYVNTADVTHIGYEQDPSGWQVLGTGSGASAGQNNPTGIRADSAILLPDGTYGICLVNDANTNHRYTNGNGTNEIATSGDGIVTISAGSVRTSRSRARSSTRASGTAGSATTSPGSVPTTARRTPTPPAFPHVGLR